MFDRTINLIGLDNYQKIKSRNVLILGIGGVGGYAIEVLVRSGVEKMTIVDYDRIDISNINRQIIALSNNINSTKVDAWKKRILAINPNAKVNIINDKVSHNNIELLFNDKYDYIIDACDTISVKKRLIKECKERNINLITICGMGKKINPALVKICDLKDTSYDPLARELRKYVKKECIKGKIPCVFSSEKPISSNNETVASMAMVPSVAGVLAAYYCIDKMINS